MKHRLEEYKFFPYLAWLAVFTGAFSLYTLTTNASDKIYQLELENTDIVMALEGDFSHSN